MQNLLKNSFLCAFQNITHITQLSKIAQTAQSSVEARRFYRSMHYRPVFVDPEQNTDMRELPDDLLAEQNCLGQTRGHGLISIHDRK
jgi:putative ribosome biogenesis GTPase RsgA